MSDSKTEKVTTEKVETVGDTKVKTTEVVENSETVKVEEVKKSSGFRPIHKIKRQVKRIRPIHRFKSMSVKDALAATGAVVIATSALEYVTDRKRSDNG